MAKTATKPAVTRQPPPKAPGKAAPPATKAQPPAVVKQSGVPANIGERLKRSQGKGIEQIGIKDMMVPFLKILDKSSREVDEARDEFIEGARPGMIINSVTRELYDGKEGITVIPCGFKSVILEWESTEPGSGFIAEHPSSSDIKADAQKDSDGRLVLENGHCLVDAANHFVILIQADGTTSQAIISMTSTNLTPSRRWNSLMASYKVEVDGERFTPAIYDTKYILKTKNRQSDEYSWYIWDIFHDGVVEDDEIAQTAADFYQTINEGRARAAYQTAGAETQAPDDDIPFEA